MRSRRESGSLKRLNVISPQRLTCSWPHQTDPTWQRGAAIRGETAEPPRSPQAPTLPVRCHPCLETRGLALSLWRSVAMPCSRSSVCVCGVITLRQTRQATQQRRRNAGPMFQGLNPGGLKLSAPDGSVVVESSGCGQYQLCPTPLPSIPLLKFLHVLERALMRCVVSHSPRDFCRFPC